MGEGRGEGKTTAPISDGPQTQGRLKSPATPNLTSGNRLKEYNGIEYTYDALGNLIYRQLPDGENQYYQYDLENQLVRAEIKKPAGNTEIWTYAYDPFGRRLSKERQDKLAWTSTAPKRTHFVWDGSRLLQEYTYKGSYTYIYTDQDSYEPLAQVFQNNRDEEQYLAYFHNDQIGIPREMTDIHGNLLWYGEYTAWGRLKKDGRVYKDAHQPFRLQNQYYDSETGLHYNYFRYYDSDTGRFVSQDVIGLVGGENFYQFSPNTQSWIDPLGLKELYYLVARKDGFYPVMEWGKRKPVGKIWLKKGDIWKIGETKNIVKGVQRRYSQKWLDRNNLKYIRVMKGPKKAMQRWERLKIIKYIKRRGKLPAGNKCKH